MVRAKWPKFFRFMLIFDHFELNSAALNNFVAFNIYDMWTIRVKQNNKLKVEFNLVNTRSNFYRVAWN